MNELRCADCGHWGTPREPVAYSHGEHRTLCDRCLRRALARRLDARTDARAPWWWLLAGVVLGAVTAWVEVAAAWWLLAR